MFRSRYLLIFPLLLRLSAATFYVGPTGDDRWSGRRDAPNLFHTDGPFATLTTALAAARATARSSPAEAVVIELCSGRYELASPLVFTADDSGLTIQAHAGVKPILSGGVRLRGWKRSPTNSALWQVSLPEVKAGQWYIRQLFLNGERLQRARTPNVGFFRARARLGTGSPIEVPFRPGDIQPGWTNGAEFLMLMKWTALQVPIASVDSSANVATLPGGPRQDWMDEPDARYWIENTSDALDQPGEWYLDRATGVLGVLMPNGLDPNQAELVAPRLHELVRWQGDAATRRAVSRVSLRGLVFADADYDLPAAGRIDLQAASGTRGNLRAEFATDCTIEDCTLENLGGYGLELGRGCQRWRVIGNDFRSLGAGGVRIGEPGETAPDTFAACHSHAVTDNEIHRLGRLMPPACGVIIFQSGTNRIAHNHIHDLYYTGISVGWNWGYRATPCRANLIEFNHVHDVGQGRLSDMGGIYTLGPQPGTVVRNNLFHDIVSYDYGGWGLYTDEGSTGILLENNVVYRCKSAGFHQHYGRDNVVRNNLIAFNSEHSVMRTRAEEHRSFWFTNNVIVADSGELLGSNWNGTTNNLVSDGNLWFDLRLGADSPKYQFAGGSWAQWQSRGQDVHSRIADPLLMDPKHPEKGLRRHSPAYPLGFKAIDLSTVGVRPRGARD
jgi:parallel beta-helix repeat protein